MVIVNSGKVCLIDGADGHTIWGPSLVDGCGGAPTVADVDGDGYPEIGVAGMRDYFCLATDGALKWRDPGQDLTSSATGSSVFDIEGDGESLAECRASARSARSDGTREPEHSLWIVRILVCQPDNAIRVRSAFCK